MQPRTLTLGHSPDADDAFMFYALAKGAITTGSLRFEHVLQDIETLNQRATRGELDITAISFHAYVSVADKYALLPCGGSMGDGYGPVVVAKRKLARSEIAGRKIAVPGRMTSAFLALQLWLGKPASELDHVVVPFDKILQTVVRGDAEVGLLIHEGQLTYGGAGLQLCVDLGRWWHDTQNGLPLPLGGNAIHKRIPTGIARQAASLINSSIRFALDHRAEAINYALEFARGLDRVVADKFIRMYVNELTLDYGIRGREAIRRFFTCANQHGLISHLPELEFVG